MAIEGEIAAAPIIITIPHGKAIFNQLWKPGQESSEVLAFTEHDDIQVPSSAIAFLGTRHRRGDSALFVYRVDLDPAKVQCMSPDPEERPKTYYLYYREKLDLS